MELCHKSQCCSTVRLNTISGKVILRNYKLTYNRYARDEASFEEVKQAATKANALKFIENNEFGKIIFSTFFFIN